MAIESITSSLLSQNISPPSTANQLASDLDKIASDLAKNDMPAAQEDYVKLTEDALNGSTLSPKPAEVSNTAESSASPPTINLLA